MQILSLTIENYKCFHRATTLELSSGFNIVGGQNNVGKTALLEALSLSFPSKPHRSPATVPTRARVPNPSARALVTFRIDRGELNELFALPGLAYIPLPRLGSEFAETINYKNDHVTALERFDEWLRTRASIVLKAELLVGPPNSQRRWQPFVSDPWNFDVRPIEGSQRQYLLRRVADDNSIHRTVAYGDHNSDFSLTLAEKLAERTYRFAAERVVSGMSPAGTATALSNTGENLAAALALLLQSNPERARRFNEMIRQVIPSVEWVSTAPVELDSRVFKRIKVWRNDPQQERDDLAVPLEDSGTGVAQVLAIFYVLMTSEHPRTILIDEPQSFLHPGAARKLIEVLRTEFSQHQFVVSTHSPAVMNAADPDAIFLVRNEHGVATVEPVDMRKAENVLGYLAEVGTSLADVYGADRILWVEGPTEEKCFPRVLRILAREGLHGTVMKAVINTGDFEGKKAELILQVYKRLASAPNLIAPTVGFIFDDECRTTQQKAELSSRSDNKVRFLPRRMYESYLLYPPAIATVLNEHDSTMTKVQEQQVADLLERLRLDKRANRNVSDGLEGELMWVDAAWILKEIFTQLSGARVAYIKTIHSVAITDWLLKNKPEDLRELATFLHDLGDLTA